MQLQDLHIGFEFRNQHMPEYHFIVRTIDDINNRLAVRIIHDTKPGHEWTENDWNLQHSLVGFERGEYYQEKPTSQPPVNGEEGQWWKLEEKERGSGDWAFVVNRSEWPGWNCKKPEVQPVDDRKFFIWIPTATPQPSPAKAEHEGPHIRKEDIEEEWENFWKGIVCHPDGTINIDQLKKELHDFSYVMAQVPKVYCHITGDKLSKIMYPAESVIAVADDHLKEIIDQELKDYEHDVQDFVETASPAPREPEGLRWVSCGKRMPPDDYRDEPKQHLFRGKGDDPRSGWAYVGYISTVDIKLSVKNFEYCEWLESGAVKDAEPAVDPVAFGNFLLNYTPLERGRNERVWWDKVIGGKQYTTEQLKKEYLQQTKQQ